MGIHVGLAPMRKVMSFLGTEERRRREGLRVRTAGD